MAEKCLFVLVGQNFLYILLHLHQFVAAELEQRLRSRGDTSEEQIVKRLDRSAWEMEQGKKYDYYVINDQVETCAEEILNIIANAK